jgi:hypothetical protein
MKSKISDLAFTKLTLFMEKLDNEGGFLTSEQAQYLQNEIENNYIGIGNFVFGQRNNDIRQSLFNFDNPYIFIKFNDLTLRVINGLVEGVPFSGNRRKTYLLYADYQVIAKFYTLEEVRIAVRKIDFYLNKNNVKSDNLKI